MIKSKLCNLQNTNIIDYNECPYDHGGYFIVGGNEKVVISNDRICENIPFVFKDKNGNLVCEVRSTSQDKYCPPKLFKIVLSQTENQMGFYIRCMVQNINKDNYDIPLFTLFRQLGVQSDKDIVQLCAYDINDQQIIGMLEGSIFDGNQQLRSVDATEVLSRKIYICNNSTNTQVNEYSKQNEYCKKQLIQVINTELLPHIGTTEKDNYDKAIYIGYMTNKLIKTAIGQIEQDDRDSFKNKRIDTCGYQMGLQFRYAYNHLIRSNVKVGIKKALREQNMNEVEIKELLFSGQLSHNHPIMQKFFNTIEQNNHTKFIKSSMIEGCIKYALATGTWVRKSIQNCKKGVAQILYRLNYPCTISYLRRINTSMEKNDKIIEPRKIHNTSYGVICPNETPESDQTGLMKHLSVSAVISNKTSYSLILQIINQSCILDIEKINRGNLSNFRKRTKFCINGKILGFLKGNPEEIYKQYKKLLLLKHQMQIDIYTSITFDFLENTIYINTEAGRLLKPVFIVDNIKNGIPYGLYQKIMNNDAKFFEVIYSCEYDISLIEYVDVQHMTNTMIAMNYKDFIKEYSKYDYLELNQCFSLGTTSSIMPFSHHNQSPRNCYFTSMAKQAIGVYSTKYNERFDSSQSYIIQHVQRPLVTTRLSKYLFQGQMYMGQMVTFALCTYTGFNQEDSLIVNQSAVQRGLFNNMAFKSYKEIYIKNNSTCETEIIQKIVPDPNKPKPYDYSKLQDDGTVPENEYVEKDTVIISKVMPQQNKKESDYKDTSCILKGSNDKGFIDKMAYNGKYFNSECGDGQKQIRFRIRNLVEPQIGDKLASMGAQKGTIGLLLQEWDMPFTADGMVPDVILNTHAIPSRMTVGQLLEVLFGHICSFIGAQGYANTFDSLSCNEMEDLLMELGLNCYGEKIFYNGMTGEQIRCSIFSGPCYYQRLKHLASNKIHSRAAMGPITQLLRQPSEGRQKHGGLRCGYMENDALIAHGIFSFHREKYLYCSDYFYLVVCNKCQQYGIHNKERLQKNKNFYHFTCQNQKCGNKTDISVIYIPYAFKQFVQELETSGIHINLQTNQNKKLLLMPNEK